MEQSNIAKKIITVMAECSHVGKNGVNDYHGYKYVTAEDVLQKVNESLTRNKLASIVMPKLESMVDVTNLKGNTEHLATVSVKVCLIDSDSGESVELYGVGSGQDSGDKAVMKAQTAAIKYAYMLSLCIATGDDPEADAKTDENSAGERQRQARPVRKAPVAAGAANDTCAYCGVAISERVKQFSVSNFGRALCMDCQKHVGKVA